MMNTDYLQKMIHDEAVNKFNYKWDTYPADSEARQAYQRLLNTNEFSDFKTAMIKIYEKEITSNVLHSLEGVRRLVKEAGEE